MRRAMRRVSCPAPVKSRLAAAVSILLLCFPGPASAEQVFRHALRLDDGAAYGRRIFFSQKMLVGVASLNGEIARTVTLDLTFRKAADATDGGEIIAVTYDFLFYSEDGIAGRSGYNSREGGPVPQAVRGLAPLIGRSFTMRTDREGRICAIEGVDDGSAAAILSLFPVDPVAVGGSWPWSLSIAGQGQSPSLLSSTLTVKELAGDSATIGIRSVLKPGSTAPGRADDGALALGFGLSGTQEGEFAIDQATGMPVKGSLRQHFSGSITLTAGPRLRLPGGQLSVPMNGEGMLTLSSF